MGLFGKKVSFLLLAVGVVVAGLQPVNAKCNKCIHNKLILASEDSSSSIEKIFQNSIDLSWLTSDSENSGVFNLKPRASFPKLQMLSLMNFSFSMAKKTSHEFIDDSFCLFFLVKKIYLSTSILRI